MTADGSLLYRPVPLRRLSDDVLRQLVARIAGGHIPPGVSLPSEAELAQQFGVSRTVAHEAVRALVSKGLVAVKTRTGIQVRPADQWDHLDPLVLFERVRAGQDEVLMEEVFELRRVIEMEGAALASLRHTPSDLQKIRTAAMGMRALVEDPEAFTRLDLQFHDAVMAAAHNRLLQQALRPVSQVLAAGRFISSRRPGSTTASQQCHEIILDAIEHGSAEDARSAMHRHVMQFENDFRAGLGQESVGDATLADLSGRPEPGLAFLTSLVHSGSHEVRKGDEVAK